MSAGTKKKNLTCEFEDATAWTPSRQGRPAGPALGTFDLFRSAPRQSIAGQNSPGTLRLPDVVDCKNGVFFLELDLERDLDEDRLESLTANYPPRI
ncbi:hypothetical protein OCK02_21420 [Rhizobium sp. TRM96647]|uniref:hypothetical protein n=1 Tax=unclassified Rhizobium TaxID=2613769 RepID=UPI0021E89C78|nr:MULTISPECIES: hypothetical protein [unclassified Rhizobium]MCV3738748.1 hypothetical protein [Rhizobium sp. TRM96647]MCV3760435.1 hypothetical protein [Rhizobium sp. TRM96650]